MRHGLQFRRRELDDRLLLVDEAGHFGVTNTQSQNTSLEEMIANLDQSKLREAGLVQINDLERRAFQFQKERRRSYSRTLDYLILVPTLRCNLSCSYCQVSRAAFDATGYDWSNETIDAVKKLLGTIEAPAVKIEFQGGEPTLRPDILQAVVNAVPSEIDATFVICSNLQEITNDVLAVFDRSNVIISTSLDGTIETQAVQRNGDSDSALQFANNLDFLIDRYGSEKISALPTINTTSLPEPDELINAFARRGLRSIFLRPINYQGFARKFHSQSKDPGPNWRDYHERFIRRLVELNWSNQNQVLEETYFSILLKRIFHPGTDRHVDIRNPNPIGYDYVLIDYDGQVYPTDEARMLTRSGVMDLSIGDIHSGWDTPERAALNQVSTLDGDPVCEQCVYKPFCGRDIFDDISRYGRIDINRSETEFCRRHIHLFDLAFNFIYSDDESIQYSMRKWLGLASDRVQLGTIL